MPLDSAGNYRHSRPWLQFSFHSMFVLMGLFCCGLAAWRISGMKLLGQYLVLVYSVGPWFAYLFAESLPIQHRFLRLTLANSLLATMFLAGLKLVESLYAWPYVFYLTALTVLLWTPQYVAFFWRRAAGL